MEYRNLGRTGIRVSAIGLGCEGFAEKDAATCARMMDAALHGGMNFLDVYTSDPALRTALGTALHHYPRGAYVIQGHLCTAWKDGQYVRTRDIAEVKASFADLLDRMALSYVDVGMIHYVDVPADFDAVMQGAVLAYAKQLRADGTIKSIGMSTHNPDVAMAAAESGEIDVIMLSVNPAYDMLPPNEDVDILFEHDTFARVYEGIDPRRAALYQRCAAAGVAITVMKPFAGGLLLDDKQSPFGRAMTPTQCIGYCLDRPAVASVLGGMASEEEIRRALYYCKATAAEKDYSAVLANAPDSAFHGHCMYCGHCAPCAVKIDIAAVNKYLDLAQAQGFVPETVREHYRLLPHHADECAACGSCMKNCPFGVNVIEKMRQAAALFVQ